MSTASNSAELSSLSSQIDDLTGRLVAIGDLYRVNEGSLVAAEIDTAERGLMAARRAIDRARQALPRS